MPELQPIVDEQLEEAIREADEKTRAANKGPDWDQLCAYRTFKVVRIRDFKLGLTYWSIVTSVVLYVVVFAFSIEGKHQQQEQGVGTILTKVFGKAYSGSRVFDAADLRFPVVEPSGAFILTRQVTMTQTRGKCVDWDAPRKCPCREGETCNAEKYCEVSTWCPSLGDHNAHKSPASANVEEIQGIDRILLKIMSGIAFPGIGNRFYVTGGSDGASNQFLNVTVGQVLNMTDPPTKLEKKVQEYGALVGVSFFWNCDVSGDCEPSVVIKRLDSGQGFVQKRSRISRKAGVETREALYLNGIRIIVDSSGIGRKSSLVLAVVQIGSAIALIRVAAIVADFIMLNGVDLCGGFTLGYNRLRREAYYSCKVKETSDYSDLQDRLNLVNANKVRREGGASGAGPNVALGLGTSGRGGLASVALRGR